MLAPPRIAFTPRAEWAHAIAWQVFRGELTPTEARPLHISTVDSLHVANALELKASRFWTFDEPQAKLAEAKGLHTP